MLRLQKKEFDVEKIIEKCTGNIKDSNRKKRIDDSKDEIVRESAEYDRKAKRGELSTIVPRDVLNSGAQKDDMVWLYENKFAKEGQEGRSYYDQIKALSPNFICPYCAQRDVETLDHYLPKAKYPVFAVTPDNLVPSCAGCNKTKTSSVFTSRSEETIHPYYDDFASDKWIAAKMIRGEAIGFRFMVRCPGHWDEVKKQRAKAHFEQFKLNNIYKNYAAQEFSACLHRIKREYRRGGKALAVSRLQEDIEDKDQIQLNTWQAAMYQAIIDTDWFWKDFLPRALSEP